MSERYSHRLRVRYSECDPQGIVFNAHYVTYFDIALTELWREAIGPYAEMVSAGAGDREEREYLSVVKVRRLGDFRLPVEVEVGFEDGEVVREQWDGRSEWTEYRYRRSCRLKQAEVDPEGKLTADLDYRNNRRTLKQQRREDRKPGGGMLSMIKYALNPH